MGQYSSYGSAAVKLTTCQLADMNSYWNTVYRGIFGFRIVYQYAQLYIL